jgi:hypothetical protein
MRSGLSLGIYFLFEAKIFPRNGLNLDSTQGFC